MVWVDVLQVFISLELSPVYGIGAPHPLRSSREGDTGFSDSMVMQILR